MTPTASPVPEDPDVDSPRSYLREAAHIGSRKATAVLMLPLSLLIHLFALTTSPSRRENAQEKCCAYQPRGEAAKEDVGISEEAGPSRGTGLLTSSACSWCH